MGEQLIKKPDNVDSFKKWIFRKFGIEFGAKFRTNYETNVEGLQKKLRNSPFWLDVSKEIPEINDRYRANNHGLSLYSYVEAPCILTKKPEDVINKAYRQNVLENDGWPKELSDGWILPTNIFTKLNDTLRTEFIVKYLDGVDFLLESLTNIATKHNIGCCSKQHAKEEGYYAKHIYFTYDTTIVDFEWEAKAIKYTFEIQIRTQLQDTINKISHQVYEGKRIKECVDQDSKAWRWEYRRPEFIANYLGHLLHLVDGLILRVKGKKEG